MPDYLFSICYPAGATPPSTVQLEAITRDIKAVNDEIKTAGAWVYGGALVPDSATVVRVDRGAVLVTDGPFVETKEQIGGIGVIRAADLEAALKWAEKLARACTVPIEVRPMQSHG